jgi:peroxiredoxin
MVVTKAHTRRERTRARRQRQTMLQAGVLVGLVALVVALAAGIAAGQGRVSGPARLGQAMPDFTLASLAGQPVKLSDYAGRPVLLNAWATWCPPCRAEMPALQAFYEAHRAEGLELLAVNAGEAESLVASFIGETGFTFPVLLDPAMQVLEGLGVRSYPTSILIGRDGQVKLIHTGLFTPQALEADVAPLLD